MNINVPDELKGQKILVTGGGGAIGSRLTRALASVADVTVIDDFSSGYRGSLDFGCRLVSGSVNESGVLHRAFSDRPRYVFHLAANFANQSSVDFPEKDLTVNGLGTLRVLEAAVRNGAERIVYSSSSCVYGSQAGSLDEGLATRHLDTPYAITKLLGEYYVNYFADSGLLEGCSVRFFNSYGPSELPGPYRNVIPNFILKALRGEPLVITGDGSATRDFTFIDDTVEGTLLAMVRGLPGAVYNIGTGIETSVRYLAEKVNILTGNPVPIQFGSTRSWDKIHNRKADISLSRRQLGYRPSVGFDEGLATTVDWLRENRDRIECAIMSR